MAAESRTSILERLRKKIADGLPIIGGGAGTGISAKCEEAGGIDLIVIYNSGRYRMAGRGSLSGVLAYGNANEIVKEMAYEVITAVDTHARTRRSEWNRPIHVAGSLLAGTERPGLRGNPKFSNCGTH